MTVATNDMGLLEAFQQGEPWAERQVFDRFYEPLSLYADRIIDDLAAAEDIVSEAMIKVLDRREDFAVLPKLKSFLYQVVHNASINHLVAEKRHQAIHQKIGYAQRQESALIEDVNKIELIQAEVLREIYAEVENLPGKCKTIFKMIFVQGMDNEQIAAELGINVQTVRSQKHRAIGIIRTALLKKNNNDPLHIVLGNPGLRPSVDQSYSLSLKP